MIIEGVHTFFEKLESLKLDGDDARKTTGSKNIVDDKQAICILVFVLKVLSLVQM